MLRRSLSFAVLLIAARFAAAQAPDTSTRARVDRVFAAYDRTDSPGCAVGVYRDGHAAMARGYGMANLELNVAVSPQSVFDIGSTSKQFTATSVFLLAQQGKLSLDDDIRKYIPELPNYGKTITIRHILTHTSGIRDYLTLWGLAGVDDADLTTEDDALQLIVRQRELNFMPGEQWLYSNSGFFLASIIVRRVSGKSLAQFADEQIFRPLGMTHTRYNDDHMAVIPNRATGYAERPGGGFATAMSNFEQTGDGGVQTSIEDLMKWDENFYHPTVGGAALLEALQTVAVLNDGKKQTYALGLTVDNYRGLRTVSHGGSWAGYRAELMRFPDQHFSVATLCNLANANPTLLSRRVAEIFLSDKMPMDAPPVATVASQGQWKPVPTSWSPAASELATFAGTYYSPELETTYWLRVENGKLMLIRRRETPTEMTPAAPDSFRTRGLVFAFTREKGKPNGFTVDAGRTKNLRFDRTK